MKFRLPLLVFLLIGAQLSHASADAFSDFVGLKNFSDFRRSTATNNETVLTSPEIKSAIEWNELIVSWNAEAPDGTFLKVEARAIEREHATKFYTIAVWSLDNKAFPRTSVGGQKDGDATVETDTVVLKQSARVAQVRITFGGTNRESAKLRFLGLSFCNTDVKPHAEKSNRTTWGKIISTPERSQFGYPDAKGWCSPACLSMLLTRWADALHRPELNVSVPEVAAAVYDKQYDGTGNWVFNAAFAGSFKDMRSYVTRFSDISEVEDWIATGIPVILSARWDLLLPGRPVDNDGHLVVCIGFTENGDVVVNDPATNQNKESVRRIYKRGDVIRAWAASHNTVYLVYPESVRIPKNRFRQWEEPTIAKPLI
jgi:hypothetical protein